MALADGRFKVVVILNNAPVQMVVADLQVADGRAKVVFNRGGKPVLTYDVTRHDLDQPGSAAPGADFLWKTPLTLTTQEREALFSDDTRRG